MSKSCFVIMPISTPPDQVELYDGDTEHFQHVLKYLFTPAAQKAGFDVIEPIAEGAEVIQGRIIEHLESADLVLCDMSLLNANVFFELGMRTALNKPVALVVDRHTANVPFDITIINHREYDGKLKHWDMPGQIDSLANHLTAAGEQDANSLWKYFGATRTASPHSEPTETVDQIILLNRQVEALRQQMASESRAAYNERSRRLHEKEAISRAKSMRWGEITQEEILAALGMANWNLLEAAEILSVSSEWLLNRMKVLKIQPPDIVG